MLYYLFFNDTATTEIYPLSRHDALPISATASRWGSRPGASSAAARGSAPCRTSRPGGATPPATRSTCRRSPTRTATARSEEHTSELQSRQYLVCRLLLEKKKKTSLYRST